MKARLVVFVAIVLLGIFAVVGRQYVHPEARRFDSVMADTTRFDASVRVIHDTVTRYVQVAGDHADNADRWIARRDSLLDSLAHVPVVVGPSVPLIVYQALDSAYHERVEEVGAVRTALAFAMVNIDQLQQRLALERRVAVDVRNLVQPKVTWLAQVRQRCGVIAGVVLQGASVGLGCRVWP